MSEIYSKSFWSRFFLWSSIKGISSMEGKFVYNFFTSDERVNEQGLEAVPDRTTSEISQEELESPNVTQEIPRFVQLDFNFFGSVSDLANTSFADADLNVVSDELKSAFQEGRIVTEESLGSYDFMTYLYGNKQLEEACDSMFRRLFTELGKENASQLDLLKDLTKKFSVNADLLEDIMPKSLKGTSLNSLQFSSSPLFSNEENVTDAVKLNSSYAPFMLASSPMRGNLLYNLAAISRLKLAIDSQTENLNSFWSLDENIFNIPYTDVERVAQGDFDDNLEHVGFLFEKNRIFDGQRYPMPTILIGKSDVRSIIDTEVAADMTYEYKARAVYYVEVPMKAVGQYDGWVIMKFFIASAPFAPVAVQTSEAVRPLPPATIDFSYSIESDRLRIDWRDIINEQKDIKYFQVFRRRFIEQPFSLVAQLDFDDSIIRKKDPETIDPDLIIDLDYRVNYFEDSSFDHDSDFIYSIVCKDARMQSSVYSAQYRVRYDVTAGKTIVSLICEAGAPKEFPNYLIDSPRFPAMIKNSGHDGVRIIFNPECLGYITSTRNSEVTTDLFKSIKQDEDARFIFQFLNFDKLDSDNLEIFIDSQLPDFTESQMSIPLSTPFESHRRLAITQAQSPELFNWRVMRNVRKAIQTVEKTRFDAASLVPLMPEGITIDGAIFTSNADENEQQASGLSGLTQQANQGLGGLAGAMITANAVRNSTALAGTSVANRQRSDGFSD